MLGSLKCRRLFLRMVGHGFAGLLLKSVTSMSVHIFIYVYIYSNELLWFPIIVT